MAIKECIKCGMEFETKGKRTLCIPCSETKDLRAWQREYYNKSSPIENNIHIAEHISDDNIATIKCKHCGIIFKHKIGKIKRDTVIPEYCENGCRNPYKRQQAPVKVKEDPKYDLDKIVEYMEAFGVSAIQAIDHFVGSYKDIDIRVYDELYLYLKNNRSK